MKALPWVILGLVLILVWMTRGLSGYAQRSYGKADGPEKGEEKAAKKSARMAEKALKKASGSRRR